LVAPPNSGVAAAPANLTTDPEALVSAALSILAGNTGAPGPAVDLPLPQMPLTALPLQLRTLSDGSLCTLPIRYFDAQLLIATYLADYDGVAALLKDSGVVAIPQGIGKALVGF